MMEIKIQWSDTKNFGADTKNTLVDTKNTLVDTKMVVNFKNLLNSKLEIVLITFI
jgi:hypothetical protein